ncbi:uncharacterized protein LOC111366719 [Olea europaea var. sylvestris]|uniref:uncharacterized protein LOC111366719 n=1 Tax=Olea europaea var. sylvestris TaxID=158386 RepID=UPI000C1D76E4|nr:uncharacterized protein LOC111366719 [Olea europaea var. sylvestris]
MVHCGFNQSKADYSLFTKGSGNEFVALLVYIDDIVITGPNIQDLGKLKYFLGIEVARSNSKIVISQRHYALQLLADSGYLDCKLTNTPMDPKVTLNIHDGDLLPDASSYHRLIGKLIYLTISRPDITFAIYKLSQFLS